jgi:hypothetical protein
MPKKGSGKRANLPTRDELPTVGVSRLRALHLITPSMTSALVAFGEGESALVREIRVSHLKFPNGGGWSFFHCPSCAKRVRTLRLYDGRVVCKACDGLVYASQAGDKSGVVERLRKRLYGREGRLSRPGLVERPKRLEIALRRALIVQRRNRLGRLRDDA